MDCLLYLVRLLVLETLFSAGVTPLLFLFVTSFRLLGLHPSLCVGAAIFDLNLCFLVRVLPSTFPWNAAEIWSLLEETWSSSILAHGRVHFTSTKQLFLFQGFFGRGTFPFDTNLRVLFSPWKSSGLVCSEIPGQALQLGGVFAIPKPTPVSAVAF